MVAPHPAATVIAGRRYVWGARTYVMGVINLSPDSFAGDGLGEGPAAIDAALRQAVAMAAAGADFLDVGGESTRPGFTAVPAAQEEARVAPVIARIVRELDLPVSIDTTKGVVAAAAIAAGATIVNDVHGLQGDPALLAAVAAAPGVAAVAMHNQRNRPYHDVIADVRGGIQAAVAAAEAAGVARTRLIADPGFGFGWAVAQNLAMLRRLGELRSLGLPLLVGTSRKSTIGAVLDLPVEERLEAAAVAVAIAIAQGADIVRVHDVREMVRVARMTDAIVRGWPPPAEV